MESARQRAFLRLRPPCVELSAIALKFRGQNASVKAVLHALEEVQSALRELGVEDALDPKLAEYAFFPLSHVFNESQRLSARCMQVAVESVQILVSKGWKQNINPEMGKQLLILMTLLAGGSPTPTQTAPPSDDLKAAAFDCIELLGEWLTQSAGQKSLFDETGIKTVVDQVTYLLLEALTDSPSDLVQLAAAKALSRLTKSIHSRVLLASLLPRTVSALTKALRPSTQARRTHKVLALDLRLLTQILQRVLADNLVYGDQGRAASPDGTIKPDSGEQSILDEPWLKATSSQVQVALTNVAKLRFHTQPDVCEALLQLCLVVVEECPRSLADSMPIMVEAIVVLANDSDSSPARSILKHLATSYTSVSDIIKSSLYTWSMSLPRLMQGSDDRPKERALTQISTAFEVLADTANETDALTQSMASTLVNGVSTGLQVVKLQPGPAVVEARSVSLQAMTMQEIPPNTDFPSVILNHKSQEGSLNAVRSLIKNLRAIDQSNNMTRMIVDMIPNGDGNTQLSSMWLALGLLRRDRDDFLLGDMIADTSMSASMRNAPPYLISDLYSYALPILMSDPGPANESETDWRLQALALECLTLQANRLGTSFRPELIDTLYPVLSLLGSRHHNLQEHAMIALNLLASACGYASTANMLVENVDYLVNSIAIKLNSFDLSPQTPQVLLMMVKLCGAGLVPYLDDLIGSIFAALDTFHGYPQLVELLFSVLKTIVDESAKSPSLAITDGKIPEHRKHSQPISTVNDIILDLGDAKSRKRKRGITEDRQSESAPHRPWSPMRNDPDQISRLTAPNDELVDDDEESSLPVAENSGKEKPLSKTHQLLLNISQATTPHLSSPSPGVRLTLLQLLDRMAPLLAQDENSFLPLINTIWPSLVAKLFGEVRADGEGEAAYNICAAAKTIANLCENAGDFMASRIDDIFPQLTKMFKQVWGRVSTDRDRRIRRKQAQQPLAGGVEGTVDLQLVQSQTGHLVKHSGDKVRTDFTHTTDVQLINALTELLVAILLHVRLTDDAADTILGLLAPLLDEPGREEVAEALETWNADAVWVVRQRRRIEADMLDGLRGTGDWNLRGLHPRHLGSLSSAWGALREVVF